MAVADPQTIHAAKYIIIYYALRIDIYQRQRGCVDLIIDEVCARRVKLVVKDACGATGERIGTFQRGCSPCRYAIIAQTS